MAIGTRSYAQPFLPSDRIPPGVKALLISNVAIFLLLFFGRGSLDPVARDLVLVPSDVVRSLMVWQLATHLFIHTRSMLWPVVWNMLALWMFGGDLERAWGTQRFIRFYILCGAAAGACSVAAAYAFASPDEIVAGAFSSIYAVLAACAALWPDRMILAFLVFPMQLRYFMLVMAGILFLVSWGGSLLGLVQLTGLIFGYVWVKTPRVGGFDPLAWVGAGYKAWKLKRAKRKFQVYLKRQRSDQDRWVN